MLWWLTLLIITASLNFVVVTAYLLCYYWLCYLYFRNCWASHVPIPHRVRWCVWFTYVFTITAMTIATTTLTTCPPTTLRSSISDTITTTIATAVMAWQKMRPCLPRPSRSVPMQNWVVRTPVVQEAEDTIPSPILVWQKPLYAAVEWVPDTLNYGLGTKGGHGKKDGHKSTVSERKSSFKHLKFNDSMSALEKSTSPRY